MATRSSYLLQADFERLEEWCRNVRRIFNHPPYLVGSATQHSGFRDVDLRLVMPDDEFDANWGDDPVKVRLMNRAISTWGQHETRLPIDFQIQRQTEAQAFTGSRNPMGIRDWHMIPTSGVPARDMAKEEER